MNLSFIRLMLISAKIKGEKALKQPAKGPLLLPVPGTSASARNSTQKNKSSTAVPAVPELVKDN